MRPIFTRECQTGEASEVWLVGDTARLTGHPREARRAYEALRERFRGTAAAADAAFALGRLAVELDGDTTAAERWFETHLGERPEGPLAGSALGRIMDLRLERGDRKGAAVVARDYLRRFPGGPRAGSPCARRGHGRRGRSRGRREIAVRRGRSVFCHGAFVLLLIAAAAHAETGADGRTVVLVAAPGGRTVANRLRAEAAGVGIVLVDDRSAGLDDAPELVCARNRAAGVVRVWSEVRVAIYLQATGGAPALFEAIEVGADERDSLALRIVEEIRSRLLTTPTSALVPALRPPAQEQAQRPALPPPQKLQPRSDEPRAAPEVAAKESSPESAFPSEVPDARPGGGAIASPGGLALGLAAGVTGGLSSGGFGSSFGATAAIAARGSSGLGAAVRGVFPLATRDLTERGGSVRWQPWVLTREASAEPWRRPRWALTLGAEAGAAFIDLTPTADQDHVASPALMTVAVFLLGAGARAQVHEGLALRAGVSVGVASPRPVVRFDGREVASWGRPFVMVSLATELQLLAFGRRAPGP